MRCLILFLIVSCIFVANGAILNQNFMNSIRLSDKYEKYARISAGNFESVLQSERIDKMPLGVTSNLKDNNAINKSLVLRGGQVNKYKSSKKTQSKTTFNKVNEWFNSVQPITRAYLLLIIFCTIIHITGLSAPNLFGLDSSKLWQIWRYFTSVSYLGGPSMSMANNIYFLLRFGQFLESEHGSGPYAWFLLTQIIFLSIFGMVLNFPFQGSAMIASILYMYSRSNPMERIPFQFGLVITQWQLPFCMMIIDCLSQQSVGAAWPHVLGILSGHIYYFFTKVWPTLGGNAHLLPPEWIIDQLGDRPKSNIPGFHIPNKQSKAKSNKSAFGKFSFRRNQQSKGRKLSD